MDKKTRLIVMGALGGVLLAALAWMLIGGDSAPVDSTLVEQAAANAREGIKDEPVDTSPPQEKVRPKGMAPR